MKTFRAVDGRRVNVRMTEDEIADRTLLNMAMVVMPILTILLFALAAGVL